MSGIQVRKVILAAGGTGGHMFPAEALARELRARGVRVALVTDRRGAGFSGDLSDVETHHISAGGIAGGSPLKRLAGLLRLGLGFLQARGLVRRLGADAVVGFGAYASAPTVLAGALSGLRVVLHEQNAVAGRANRLLAGRADVIATGFAEVRGLNQASRRKTRMTGNPVRPAIGEAGGRSYQAPGGDGAIHLLVVGGSQGAKAFNAILPGAVERLPETLWSRLDISQQVPGGELDQVQARYRACGVSAELAGFFDDVPERLARAQLVICRAGASTVAELAGAGRPAILVPYPHATDDHQTANAEVFADAGAGWLIPEAALSPEVLAARLESLLTTPGLLESAAAAATGFAPRDSAARLADLVCDTAGDNGGREFVGEPNAQDPQPRGAEAQNPKEAAA